MKKLIAVGLFLLIFLGLGLGVKAGGDRYREHPELKVIINPYKDSLSIPLLLRLPPVLKKIDNFSISQLTQLKASFLKLAPKYQNNKVVSDLLLFLIYDIEETLQNKIVLKETLGKELCVLDVCLDKSKPLTPVNDLFVQKYTGNNDEFYQAELTESYLKDPGAYSVYKKDGTYVKKMLKYGFNSEYVEIKKGDNYYIKFQPLFGCGGSTYKQELLDLNGKLITSNIGDYPSEVSIGNYKWSINYNFNESNDGLDLRGMTVLNKRTYSPYEIKETIESLIYNDDYKKRSLQQKYIFQTLQGNLIMYKGNFEQPERIIFLGKDKKWLNENINRRGELLDMGVTNTVIDYYGENSNLGLVDSDTFERVKESFSDSDLPIFRVQRFDNKGYYLLYTLDKYKIQSFAEMCKPAVYVYDQFNRKNSLELKIQKGDYYTKLIPEFSHKNMWDFTANESGNIGVSGDNYDYLYYALKSRSYKHNRNGWIVRGENIEAFFEDKLTKINFNKKEKDDFMEYWIPKYETGKHYFVSFKYKEHLDKIIPLEFAIIPDTEFRVLLDSYELEEISEFQKRFLYSRVGDKLDTQLIQTYIRNKEALEVFEWGGVLQKGEDYIVY